MFHSSELLLSWSSRLLLVWDKMLLLACCLWTKKLLINGRLDDTLDFSLIALVFKPTDTTQLIILSPPSQQNLISHCIVLSFFPFLCSFPVFSAKSQNTCGFICVPVCILRVHVNFCVVIYSSGSQTVGREPLQGKKHGEKQGWVNMKKGDLCNFKRGMVVSHTGRSEYFRNCWSAVIFQQGSHRIILNRENSQSASSQ